MLMVLGHKFGFALELTKGHMAFWSSARGQAEFSRFCRELQGCIALGFSGLKNVDSHQMHCDSLYPLRCSMHSLVHPAAHPDGTENLPVHYSCQSGLQVVPEDLKASQRDTAGSKSHSQKEKNSSIALKNFLRDCLKRLI